MKPFVRWIWLGGLLMSLGGLIALCDKRYRRRVDRKEVVAQKDATELKETTDA